MELQTPPFWILPFRDRQIGVADHSFRGLVVFDLKGQRYLPDGKIRIYSAREHKLLVLFDVKTRPHLRMPALARSAWLAMYSYRAFLNPSLKRPAEHNFAPAGRDWEHDDFEGGISVARDPEVELIFQELSEDQEAWAHSEEGGWYYADDDGEQR